MSGRREEGSLISTREAARLLGCTVQNVNYLVRRGILAKKPGVKKKPGIYYLGVKSYLAKTKLSRDQLAQKIIELEARVLVLETNQKELIPDNRSSRVQEQVIRQLISRHHPYLTMSSSS
jgi:hypothetical protein